MHVRPHRLFFLKQKIMENKIKEKIGLKLLAQHPDIKVLWVCDDGTAFDRKTLANEYAQKIGNREIMQVERVEPAGQAETKGQSAKKTAKKAIKTEKK